MVKDEREKGSEKNYIQSPSGMNDNVLDDLHLLNSIKNGKESTSFTFLWNQHEKNLNSWFCSFFFHFYLYSHFYPFWAYWEPLGRHGSIVRTFKGPMSSFNSIATLTPALVQLPVASSIRQINGFLESAKTIAPKPKLMEDGTRAKMKKSVNVFVS